MIKLTYEKIIKLIDKYKLDKNKIVIISGAALVIHGIIDKTNDIDISCDKEYYDYLLKNYNCIFERKNENGEDIYMIDEIINFGTSFMPKEIVNINGLNVSSIKDIYLLKKYLNRKKDKEIIEKLEEII